MRLTRAFVGRSTWTVVVSLALVAACSGGDDESADTTLDTTLDTTAEPTTPVTPASAPGTTPSTEPAPATTADTTTTTTTTNSATTPSTEPAPTTTAGEQPAPGDWEPLDPASGSWLAFASMRTGEGELFAVDVDSGAERQLTDGAGGARQLAWSPDGSAIAFACPNTGPETGPETGTGGDDICLLDLTSGEVTYLTDDAAGDQGPTWSPDSTQLAFITFDDDVVLVASIDVAAGGEKTIVGEGFEPAWSPDGSVLAIVGPDGELVAIDQASGDRQVLVETGYRFSSLAWSPDGSEIAFACASGEPGPDEVVPPTDICVIAADGSSQRAIEYGGPGDADPAWSPDGTAILFTSTDFSTGQSEVVVAPAANGAPRAIADGFEPAWSPDARQIAFVAPDGGIELIDGGSGATSVASIDPTSGGLTWAPAD